MTPAPISQGLMLCERVIVEDGTGMPSCIGVFTVFDCDEFPVMVPPFYVFSPLTNAVGRCTMSIIIRELDDLNVITQHESPFELSDRLRIEYFHVRLLNVVFPRAGRFEVSLHADDDMIAQTTLTVEERF